MWLKFHQNRRYLIFQGGRSSLLGGLTIIEKSWNYGNLPYLVANTYGLNVIKIRGIWIFQGAGGQKPPIMGSYMWPAMPIFELGWAIPVQSHVWKFGSNWLSLSRVIRNPLLGGYMWPAMAIFEPDWAIPVKSHVWEFGLDWLSLSRVIVSINIFPWGKKLPLGGVTFDLWCPFSNSDVLFQSKVMCHDLAWIGWNRRYVKFEGGGRPLLAGLHVTCDAHFRTRTCYSSQKSCVKIWFGLVEIGGVHFQGDQKSPIKGGYMWPAMPIFELGRAIPVKSHVWKFGSDWLSLSRVIVSTNIQK